MVVSCNFEDRFQPLSNFGAVVPVHIKLCFFLIIPMCHCLGQHYIQSEFYLHLSVFACLFYEYRGCTFIPIKQLTVWNCCYSKVLFIINFHKGPKKCISEWYLHGIHSHLYAALFLYKNLQYIMNTIEYK